MFSSLYVMTVSVALGAGPVAQAPYYQQPGPAPIQQTGFGCQTCQAYPGYGGGYAPGYDMGGEIYPSAGVYGMDLYPYDAQEPWMHGYLQEIPAYGGYAYFRPYNYKHVLSQSQAAGGFGMAPNMPYSQQFWHRYQEQAVIQQRMTQIGASVYAAELAKLRAQHDFESQLRQAQPTAKLNESAQPSDAIAPAEFQSPAEIDELKSQLERQQDELRALQSALEARKAERAGTATPRRTFRR